MNEIQAVDKHTKLKIPAKRLNRFSRLISQLFSFKLQLSSCDFVSKCISLLKNPSWRPFSFASISTPTIARIALNLAIKERTSLSRSLRSCSLSNVKLYCDGSCISNTVASFVWTDIIKNVSRVVNIIDLVSSSQSSKVVPF